MEEAVSGIGEDYAARRGEGCSWDGIIGVEGLWILESALITQRARSIAGSASGTARDKDPCSLRG